MDKYGKQKRVLWGKTMKSLINCRNTIPDDAIFAIEGGYLLHAVVWPKRATYQAVCEACKAYIVKHYHEGATVVFDGYDRPPSTKSAEQNQRAKTCTSADIAIAPNLPTTTTQAAFLGSNCNNCNKTRLIDTLSPVLTSSGITVKQAESVADTLIVSTAFHMAERDQPVVVDGIDTDLLVMLVARAASMDMFMLCHRNLMTLYSVKQLQQALGSTRQHLLFIHCMG